MGTDILAVRCTGTAGIGGEKGKKMGHSVEGNATFSIQLFLAHGPYYIIIGCF